MVFNRETEKEGAVSGRCGGFKRWTVSARIFAGLMLVVAGLAYVSLLSVIWQDTEMKISYIAEGYGSMGAIELAHHAFRYLFWFLGIFSLTGGLYFLSADTEPRKRFFAVFVPVLIITDIGSALMMPIHSIFAWSLYASGILLALAFLFMFMRVQQELWKP